MCSSFIDGLCCVVKRTDQEVIELVELMSDLPFLERMSPEMRTFVVRYIEHESHSRDTVVFEEGDPASHVFMLLRGSVSIHVRPKNATPPAPETTAAARLKMRRKSWFQEQMAEEMFQHLDQPKGGPGPASPTANGL